MNYVLIGTCHPVTVEDRKAAGSNSTGMSRDPRCGGFDSAGSCEELFQISEGKGLGRYREIVLQVGTGHGILYKPLDDWVLPTVEWAAQ